MPMAKNHIRIALLGVGNRAGKYLSCLPDGVEVAALVDPDPLRLSQVGARYPGCLCFRDADAFFAARCQVDGVIIAAPDRLHFSLTMQAVRAGYPVLLEKPAALTEHDYRDMLEASRAAGVPVGLCLPMRYHPCFRRVREIVASGLLGPLESLDHTEFVGPDRMAHTFVSGGRARKQDAGPIFLSKCCHDADFLLSLTGGTVLSLTSSGSLTRFRASSAPEGAADRCIDCPLKASCPYSAVDLYQVRREWIAGFNVPDGETLDQVISAELQAGRYGRCVYHCDNDVNDYQTVVATLEHGVTLKITLDGISLREGRLLTVRGRDGVLTMDGPILTIASADGTRVEDFSAFERIPLHAGADRLIVEDFIASLRDGRPMTATLEASLEAHRLCFRAE